MKLSYSEENYLKAIYHLSENRNQGVNTNAIADSLNTKAASASDMIKKLAAKKLISYKKYYGVKVTDTGKKVALQIIRKHRLWEVFLVQKLNFNWDEVHEVAEELEHIKSPLLIQRLNKFLGDPKFDPHGDPIPDETGTIPSKPSIPLSQLITGKSGIITSVKDSDSSFLKYLDKMEMKIGSRIKVLDVIEFDNSMEILIDDKRKINVSNEVSGNLLMKI
jgi:DtxR family Mn-dependent transcriptional regulator